MLSPKKDPLWIGPEIKNERQKSKLIRHIAFTHKVQSFVSPQKDPLKIDPDEDILILRRKVAECLAQDKPKKNQTKDCPDCGKTFDAGYILERHIQRVHGTKVYVCDQCDAKFTCNDNLQRHVRQVHLGELVVCSFCPYKAKEKKSVMKHAKKAHPLNDLDNVTLDKVFDKQYINPYNKPQSGDCPHCGKYIKRLGRHIKTVHGQGEKKLSCEDCGKMFCQKNNLERHLKTIHLKERFQCDFCQYSGAEKRSVVKHVKLVHPSKDLDIMKFERHTNIDANGAIVERFKLLLDQ